jgi:hypothetical protein
MLLMLLRGFEGHDPRSEGPDGLPGVEWRGPATIEGGGCSDIGGGGGGGGRAGGGGAGVGVGAGDVYRGRGVDRLDGGTDGGTERGRIQGRGDGGRCLCAVLSNTGI